MTVETPGRDVVAVQMLRGIAATMVVFVHLDNQLARLHYGVLGTGWMATGVDIFFVISGFIMWTSVERRPALTAGAFIRNRVIRIVPLYWLVSLFVVAVAFLAPRLLKTTVLRPQHALASFMFLPMRHPVTGDFWPLVIPGWSLNYEMLFYVIFAIAIALSSESKLRRVVIITGVMAGILVIANIFKSRIDVLNFYASPLLLEFLAGVFLAIVWNTNIISRSWYWLISLLAGFALLAMGGNLDVGHALTVTAATMIVAGAVFLPAIRPNLLSSLGDASYSLYLTHVMAVAAVALLWSELSMTLPWELFVLAGIGASILLAQIIYTCFEFPVTVRLKRSSAFRSPAVLTGSPVLK